MLAKSHQIHSLTQMSKITRLELLEKLKTDGYACGRSGETRKKAIELISDGSNGNNITDRFFDQQIFFNYIYSMKNIIVKCF